MKKNIWTPLQIAWLVLAMFTAHNSIMALNDDAYYCTDAFCQRDDDCGASCLCDTRVSVCYDSSQSKR